MTAFRHCFFGLKRRASQQTGRKSSSMAKLRLESLEDRRLLAAGLGSALLVPVPVVDLAAQVSVPGTTVGGSSEITITGNSVALSTGSGVGGTTTTGGAGVTVSASSISPSVGVSTPVSGVTAQPSVQLGTNSNDGSGGQTGPIALSTGVGATAGSAGTSLDVNTGATGGSALGVSGGMPLGGGSTAGNNGGLGLFAGSFGAATFPAATSQSTAGNGAFQATGIDPTLGLFFRSAIGDSAGVTGPAGQAAVVNNAGPLAGLMLVGPKTATDSRDASSAPAGAEEEDTDDQLEAAPLGPAQGGGEFDMQDAEGAGLLAPTVPFDPQQVSTQALLFLLESGDELAQFASRVGVWPWALLGTGLALTTYRVGRQWRRSRQDEEEADDGSPLFGFLPEPGLAEGA